MEITRKEFDALTEDKRQLLVDAGVSIIEEKGLTDQEVKAIADEVMAPFQTRMDEMSAKQAEFVKAIEKEEVDPIFIAGLQLKQIAGKKLSEVETKALTTYGSVGTAADGGNTVDRTFSDRIMQVAVDDDKILSRLTKFNITNGQSIVIPCDETVP